MPGGRGDWITLFIESNELFRKKSSKLETEPARFRAEARQQVADLGLGPFEGPSPWSSRSRLRMPGTSQDR